MCVMAFDLEQGVGRLLAVICEVDETIWRPFS